MKIKSRKDSVWPDPKDWPFPSQQFSIDQEDLDEVLRRFPEDVIVDHNWIQTDDDI